MIDTFRITKNRIGEYLQAGKRFDGRKPEEFRDMEIEIGISENAEGSARVKLGDTEVVAGVKMAVGEPYPDSQDEGNLMVTAELLPLSSKRYEPGPPKIESIELARVIDRGIRESKFVQFDKLCIKEGEKVWTVFVDIYSINDDGNLLDASGLAAILALKNARIPKYDEETGKVVIGEWTDQKLPLSKEVPISITFHKIKGKFIVDPSIEEEDTSEARLTIGMTDGYMSSMQKGNSKELNIEEIDEILELAEKTSQDLRNKLKKYI